MDRTVYHTLIEQGGIFSLLLICFVTLLLFIFKAWKSRKHSFGISGFFLGGRNIGAALTEHTTWGTNFALANGIFYFAVLAFYVGPSIFWIQIPWSISIFILASLLPLIIKATYLHTIHGFIGQMFGIKARVTASFVTLFGYLGAFAFEVYVSTEIILHYLGIPAFTVPVALFLTLLCAMYCDIGGFKTVASIDKLQNRLGLVAIVILFVLLLYANNVLFDVSRLNINLFSKELLNFSDISLWQLVGIMCFAPFANLVDMSNWQTISANSNIPPEKHKFIRRSIRRAAVWTLFLPGLVGCFFGYLSHGIKGITEDDVLPIVLQSSLTQYNLIGGVIIGFVIIGLLATALSTADSYLLAAVQTYSWDLKNFKELEKYQNRTTIPVEREIYIVSSARRSLYMFAILSVLIFTLLVQLNRGKVLEFQFVIFGCMIALLPSVCNGLYLFKKGKIGTDVFKTWMTWSILLGFSAGLLVFIISLMSTNINVYAFSPISTLGISSLTWLAAIVASTLTKKRKKNEQLVELTEKDI